jgi:hypothetical protein
MKYHPISSKQFWECDHKKLSSIIFKEEKLFLMNELMAMFILRQRTKRVNLYQSFDRHRELIKIILHLGILSIPSHCRVSRHPRLEFYRGLNPGVNDRNQGHCRFLGMHVRTPNFFQKRANKWKMSTPEYESINIRRELWKILLKECFYFSTVCYSLFD